MFRSWTGTAPIGSMVQWTGQTTLNVYVGKVLDYIGPSYIIETLSINGTTTVHSPVRVVGFRVCPDLVVLS